MRILFSADHHHHPYQQFASVRQGGMSSRVVEGLVAEEFLLSVEREHHIDVHVRLGDLFHQKNVLDAVTFSEVYDRIQMSAVPQILLCGNHDEAAGGLRHGIEPFRHLPHVTVVSSPRACVFEGVTIYGVPYHNDVEVARQAVKQFVRQHLAPQQTPAVTFLAFHGEITGAQTGSEYKLAGQLSLQDLYPSLYTAVFCGHIHEPQQLAPNVWYVGSLLQRSFSDEGQPRSVVVFDTETRQGERLLVPGPRFVTYRDVSAQTLRDGTLRPDAAGWEQAYLKVVTSDTTVTRALVEQAVGSCQSLLLAYERPAAQPTESLQGLASWSQYLDAWVRDSETPLDKSQLLALGETILAELPS